MPKAPARDVKYSVMLSREERADFERAALAEGLDLSSWLRWTCRQRFNQLTDDGRIDRPPSDAAAANT